MRWKETAAFMATISITATACGDNPPTPLPEPTMTASALEKVGVENMYSWRSPGGTTFEFDAIDFPGTFYPEAITQALGKYCDKPLVVPNVKILIGPVEGFNPITRQPDPNGTSRGITIMTVEKNTNKPVALTIGVAGGRFEKSKNKQYAYASPHIPGEMILTNALYDLNASIAEEIGYHACIATAGTPLDKPDADAESAKFHMNFLRNPIVMFRPQGW